jgi:hypothetical protein
MTTENVTDQLPPFIMNSIPKSGTHLLKQMLKSIPHTRHNPYNEFYEGYPHDLQKHYHQLRQMKPNEFGAGHIFYSKEWANMLKQLGMKHIFLSRDPRDIIVSFTHFIVEKYPYHPLHDYFKEDLKTNKQRYLCLIHGVKKEKVKYPSIDEWIGRFKKWIKDPNTLSITFEDLMNSPDSRTQTITTITNYLWKGLHPPVSIPQMVSIMERNMAPDQSLTFRSGKTGNWKHEFDNETKEAFKKVTGNLLIELGYEKNQHW